MGWGEIDTTVEVDRRELNALRSLYRAARTWRVEVGTPATVVEWRVCNAINAVELFHREPRP